MLVSLHWSAAYSSTTHPTGVGWGLPDGGWPKFIETQILPAIEWAQSCGHTPQFVIHHPFNQFHKETGSPNMHLDGWDFAIAAGQKFLTNGFKTKSGFLSVTDRFNFYGYAGGLDPDPRTKNMTLRQRVDLTLRNLKPFADAGFKGMYIDVAENAIHETFISPFTSRQNCPVSVDTVTLALCDDMFEATTGVEAAPRAFPEFAHLWQRPVMIQDEEYVFRFGSPIQEALKIRFKYRGQNTNYKGLGYDASKLPRGQGAVVRTVDYRDNVEDTISLINAIVADGHTPGFNPYPFIKQGVKL
jgi:hypothetical protein